MRYGIAHWYGRNILDIIQELGLKLIEVVPAPDDRHRDGVYVELEPAEVVGLAAVFDVMVIENNGEMFVWLDVKGKRFHQR